MIEQDDNVDRQELGPFLQAVLDALAAQIAVLDDHGVILAVNASWRRFADENGLSWTDYGIGRNYIAAIPDEPEDGVGTAHSAAQGIRAVMSRTLDEFCYEYPCHSPDEQRWYIMWATPVDYLGRRGVVIAHENITARRRSEEAAQAAKLEAETARAAESQQRLLCERRGAVAAALKDFLSVLNSDLPLEHVLATIVERARTLLDARSVELVPVGNGDTEIGTSARDLGSSDEGLPGTHDIDTRLILGKPTGYVAVEGACGQPDWHGEQEGGRLLAPIRVGGRDYAVLVVCFDASFPFVQDKVDLVSDLALQTALAVENAALKQSLQASAVESERTRLLRELHDSVSQSLFSANLIADSLPRVWETHPIDARQGLKEIQRLTRSALLEMRGLLLDLGPTALMEQALDVLLVRLANALAVRSQIRIRLQLDRHVSLPPVVKVNLYRIAEEALNNAVKHSHAIGIDVEFKVTASGVRLTVKDDGHGFEVDHVSSGHLGLDIMRGRADDIGAILAICSSARSGTEVTVCWHGHGEGPRDG